RLRAACSEAARSGPLPFDLSLSAAARLAAARWEFAKFDPAPAQAAPTAQVNSWRSAIYGTAFGHPAETRSVKTIIRPIASRAGRSFSPSWTPDRAGKLPDICSEEA